MLILDVVMHRSAGPAFLTRVRKCRRAHVSDDGTAGVWTYVRTLTYLPAVCTEAWEAPTTSGLEAAFHAHAF
jgi:hypothetical protein